MVQLVGVELKLRLALENNVVLIHLRVHRVDLPLTEGVVQSVIDGRGRDAQSRGGDPVDHQRYRQPSRLLIGGNVFQFRQLLQPADETVGPVIQFIRIGIFQRVLVLRAAHPVVHGNVLHRLHEQLDSLNLIQLRLEPADHVGRADLALVERLQIDRHSAAVRRCIRSVRADERREAFDRRVFQNHLCELLLLLRHGLRANRLRRLRDALDDARVLHREKSLGDDDVKENREQQRAPARRAA